MKITIVNDTKSYERAHYLLTAAHTTVQSTKKGEQSKTAKLATKLKTVQEAFDQNKAKQHFKGDRGESFSLSLADGTPTLVLGLGEKSKLTLEILRRALADGYKQLAQKTQQLTVDLDALASKKPEEAVRAITEVLGMTAYVFDKHQAVKKTPKLQEILFVTSAGKAEVKKLQQAVEEGTKVYESISVARDFVNEPPNILNSEVYADRLADDAKKLPNVKVKVLNKAQMKKEKMDLFLSVNNGSAYEARVVHLTYTPKKANSKTKHIAFVGKGLTFDTGGYSLKPSDSMVNMKFDMAGSATVYAAFRAAALLGANIKLTCILGLTDNAVNSIATMPDSIVRARNGKTVEILNTDAEGRLVLADCLDYACDLKPDAIIDAATLTGACLVALGHEVCGLMSNNDKLAHEVLKCADETHERMWRLPIIEEFSQDIKSPNADLKNMGSNRFGGSSKAAAFLQEFIRDDIPWAHLDIAGIGDSQGHLPYCPTKGASGLVIRSLVNYVMGLK